jgi:hypothetical protein
MRIKQEKMNNLPTIEAGYKSESFLNQQLKGIHTGITIPLWENKNRVNQAKLEYEWSQASYYQVESMVRMEILTLYNTLKTTYSNYMEMKAILGNKLMTQTNLDLLEAQQISFPEFLVEMQFIFESENNYINTEKEYFILVSELLLISNI